MGGPGLGRRARNEELIACHLELLVGAVRPLGCHRPRRRPTVCFVMGIGIDLLLRLNRPVDEEEAIYTQHDDSLGLGSSINAIAGLREPYRRFVPIGVG